MKIRTEIKEAIKVAQLLDQPTIVLPAEYGEALISLIDLAKMVSRTTVNNVGPHRVTSAFHDADAMNIAADELLQKPEFK